MMMLRWKSLSPSQNRVSGNSCHYNPVDLQKNNLMIISSHLLNVRHDLLRTAPTGQPSRVLPQNEGDRTPHGERLYKTCKMRKFYI